MHKGSRVTTDTHLADERGRIERGTSGRVMDVGTDPRTGEQRAAIVTDDGQQLLSVPVDALRSKP